MDFQMEFQKTSVTEQLFLAALYLILFFLKQDLNLRLLDTLHLHTHYLIKKITARY